MAAKGSILKGEIAAKILETFPGSFLYNDGKEIRINGTENGVEIQIKITLTAAKEAVNNGTSETTSKEDIVSNLPSSEAIAEPTRDEQIRLQELLQKLNL